MRRLQPIKKAESAEPKKDLKEASVWTADLTKATEDFIKEFGPQIVAGADPVDEAYESLGGYIAVAIRDALRHSFKRQDVAETIIDGIIYEFRNS